MAELEEQQLRAMPHVSPPAGVDELLAFLNSIPGLATEDVLRMNNYSVVERSGGFLVANGDQSLFQAVTHGEAYSFVAGLAAMANEFLFRADPSIFLHDTVPETP